MDWIESFLQNYGIWAMFVLIMLEYACFPVSSEIILPLAGGMAAELGVPVLAKLPINPEINALVDKGRISEIEANELDDFVELLK